jgi:hypothetical protein
MALLGASDLRLERPVNDVVRVIGDALTTPRRAVARRGD